MRVIIEKNLSLLIKAANDKGITKENFITIIQMPNSNDLALIYETK